MISSTFPVAQTGPKNIGNNNNNTNNIIISVSFSVYELNKYISFQKMGPPELSNDLTVFGVFTKKRFFP
jgi:hypothetical protein